MINSFRSERGWRGRRRIAVLVSVAGVLGVAYLGSAGSASAATVANCNAKLEPKGKSNAGTKAKLTFVCDNTIRAYTLGSNRSIKSYSPPNAGAASGFLTCEGGGVGFGCGVSDRAAPGTQTPGTTGWGATFPPAPAATAIPTTCGGYSRIDNGPPTRNGIVTGPCTQVVPAGTKVTQNIKLGSSPCAGGSRDPLQMNLFVGGEPLVTSFTTGGDSSTVGESISPPIKVNLKAYKQCQAIGGKGGGAKKSAVPATKFPVGCQGTVAPFTPGVTGPDVKVSFTCDQNIRAFAIYRNKTIDLPGDEPQVSGNNGGGTNEGALHQCEGDVPGQGYGCGIVDRQTQTTALPNGQGISAGNLAEQKMGFDVSPCQKPGEPKTKVWVIAMGEPITSASTVGEFTSAPQQLALTGYGKCKGGKGHGGNKGGKKK